MRLLILLLASAALVAADARHITGNVRAVQGDPAVYKDGQVTRVDSLGHFVFLKSLEGEPLLRTGETVERLRIFDRIVRTSEAIALFRGGM